MINKLWITGKKFWACTFVGRFLFMVRFREPTKVHSPVSCHMVIKKVFAKVVNVKVLKLIAYL